MNVADINPTSLNQLIEELKSKGAKTLQVCLEYFSLDNGQLDQQWTMASLLIAVDYNIILLIMLFSGGRG